MQTELPLLVDSPNVHNGYAWVKWKLEARNLIQDYMWMARVELSVPSSTTSHWQEAGIRRQSKALNPGTPVWNVGILIRLNACPLDDFCCVYMPSLPLLTSLPCSVVLLSSSMANSSSLEVCSKARIILHTHAGSLKCRKLLSCSDCWVLETQLPAQVETELAVEPMHHSPLQEPAKPSLCSRSLHLALFFAPHFLSWICLAGVGRSSLS